MPRNDAAKRLVEIGHLLEQAPQGLTVKELEVRLQERGYDAATRTVYRDLEAASDLYPITEAGSDDNGGKRFIMAPFARVAKHLVLNPRELFALYFARGALEPLKETPFFKDIAIVFKKIESLLGPRGLERIQELGGSFKFEAMPKWGLNISSDFLDTVQAACEERHPLEGVYSSTKDNQARERRLGPHFLYYAKGGIYLVAEDLDEGKVKTYSLPRFQSIKMVSSSNYDKEPLEPTEFFGASFGVYSATEVEEVELVFDPAVARFVSERQWHASQRVVFLEEGRARLSLSVALTPEFVSWVLGFGPNVRVTRSERLIKLIVEQAAKVREMYWKRAG